MTESVPKRWMIPTTLMILLTCSFPSVGRTELLPEDQLAGCQLHVVGVYAPSGQSSDDRIQVTVGPLDQPVVLVCCSYFGAQWNFEIDDKTKVRQIIISGYYESSHHHVPDGIPVEVINYFRDKQPHRDDYFWAYAWHTQRGRELRSRLKDLTGLDITTFQGEYNAKRFVIDGTQGDVEQYDTPVVQQTPELKRPDSSTNAGLPSLDPSTSNAETIRTIEASMAVVDDAIEKLMQELTPVDGSAEPVTLSQRQRAMLQQAVEKAFELETQLHQERVAKAEARLELVKQQLRERQRQAKRLVDQRVASLIARFNSSDVTTQSDRQAEQHSAALLSSEGWDAWRKQDLRTALSKFQQAIKQQPDYAAARNGLGWTYIHLGEFDKAISTFESLLKEEPDLGGAQNGLGQSLLAKGKLDEAEKVLLHSTQTAIERFGEAGTVRQNLTASWYGLVRTYLRQKDFANAKKWAERYLKYKPDDEAYQSMLREANEGESQAMLREANRKPDDAG